MADRTLVVIIGAGASYDCVDPNDYVVRGLKPPLTKELFDNRQAFLDALDNYPGARNVSAKLVASVTGGKPIEVAIREGMESANRVIRKCYDEVPLYLQNIIGQVSNGYITRGANRYHAMIEDIESRTGGMFRSVMYLSLNYDTLLERALRDWYQVGFVNLPDYLPSGDRKWALVKPHGSITWGFPLFPTAHVDVQNDEYWLRELLQLMRDNDKEPRPVPTDLKIVSPTSRLLDGQLMYPALAAPAVGKTEFICPPEHTRFCETVMAEATDLLVVGCALMDMDVIALLAKGVKIRNLMIANGSQQFGADALENLSHNIEHFRKFGVNDETCLNFGFAGMINQGHHAAMFDRK